MQSQFLKNAFHARKEKITNHIVPFITEVNVDAQLKSGCISSCSDISLDILTCKHPSMGLKTVSTVSLHEHQVLVPSEDKEVRIELISAALGAKGDRVLPSILANVAFGILRAGECWEGMAFANILAIYIPDYDLKHVVIVDAAFYKDIAPYETEDTLVKWFVLVPVSEAELEYGIQHGIHALKELLKENNINICDLTRSSLL